MASKREKSVSYRRAEWFAEASGLTLEKCIRDANKALTTVEARTINRGGQNHTTPNRVVFISTSQPTHRVKPLPSYQRQKPAQPSSILKPRSRRRVPMLDGD